jgi:hypothetical protein
LTPPDSDCSQSGSSQSGSRTDGDLQFQRDLANQRDHPLPGSEAMNGGFAATRHIESPMYAVRTGVILGPAVRSDAIVGAVNPQWITLLPARQSIPRCPSTDSVLPCINHLSHKHWCTARWDATCNRYLQRHPFVKPATSDKLQPRSRATVPHNRPKNR